MCQWGYRESVDKVDEASKCNPVHPHMTVYYTIGIDDLFPKFVTPRMFISFLSLVLHRRKFRLAFLNAFAASHRMVSSSGLPSLRHLWLEGSNIYSRSMALLLFFSYCYGCYSRRHCPMVRSKSESPEKARDASRDNSNSSREKKRALRQVACRIPSRSSLLPSAST